MPIIAALASNIVFFMILFTLMIAGNSSGDRPTASATANKSNNHGTTEKQIRRQDEQDDDDHHAVERDPNWRTPRAKSVSGWRVLSRAAITPNAVRRPVSTARIFAVPLWTDAPKTAFVRAERAASGFTVPRRFSTRKNRPSCSLR